MTEAEKKMKKYTGAVQRHLNLPRDVKARVMSDFISSITARREAGCTDEEIYAELGDARKAAADLNEQMKEFTYRKSPWRFAFLAVAVLAGLRLVYRGVARLVGTYVLHQANVMVIPEAASVGVIGGADGPTAIFVTTPAWTEGVTLGLLLIAGIAGYLFLHRRKRK